MIPEKMNKKCKRQIKRWRKNKGCKDRTQQFGSLGKWLDGSGVLQLQQRTSEKLKAVALAPTKNHLYNHRLNLLNRADGDWPPLVLGCLPVSYWGESNKSARDAQEPQDHTGEANIKEQHQHFGVTIQIWIFNADISSKSSLIHSWLLSWTSLWHGS